MQAVVVVAHINQARLPITVWATLKAAPAAAA
jgi:hypothetical protein